MLALLSFVIALLPLVSSFVHPGLLVSNSDTTRAREKIRAGRDPWTTSWKVLTSLSFSDASYTPSPFSAVYRSSWDRHAENAELIWHDVAATFNLALRRKITGNTSFAESLAISYMHGQPLSP
jgi:hypothetical protein